MIKRSLLLSLLLVTGGLQAQDQAPDLEKGKEIAGAVCAGCHGADGNSAIADNPKLAGQIPEYLYKQLRNFSSIDGAAPVRENAVMNSMVAALTDEDRLAVAHYYAQQATTPSVAANNDTVDQGRHIWRAGIAAKGVPACAACHGPAGAGMPAQYPRLSGQHAKYTLTQLQNFREGTRSNDPAEMMRMIALKMTDKEMAAVADYAAGLRHKDD